MTLDKKLSLVTKIPIVGALFILVFANIALLIFDPIKRVDADSLPTIRSWVYWAATDYRQRQKTPDVVYLGSSVMMHPTWWQEATFRNKDVDLVADHTSHYGESMIGKYSGVNNLSCFNFGLPGAVPSDAYMIVKSLFKEEKKPKLVVLGMVPRDMVDNDFSHAGSSRHYRYLSRFVDTTGMEELAVPNIWERPQYWVNDFLYLKGKSQPIQQVARHEAESLLAPALKSLPGSPLDRVTDEDRKFAMHHAELEKGVWVAHPTTPYFYVEAADADCLKRYATPNNELFQNQKTWLDMTLKALKDDNIEVLVVNFPVTNMALRCMRDGVYDRHVSTLKAMAAKYDFGFLDAQASGKFLPEDFTDWAHMDASGGEKVHDLIGQYIGSKQKLVAKLGSAASTSVAGKEHNQL
ncbi:MAG: hypothetical protein K2X93_01460 [Candidatus Obscuribacterales bacterium]|nr:hypothetical protein [Candidatus Obscuribacterales bacterium]